MQCVNRTKVSLYTVQCPAITYQKVKTRYIFILTIFEIKKLNKLGKFDDNHRSVCVFTGLELLVQT